MNDPKHIHPPQCCCQIDPRDLESGDVGFDRVYPLVVCPLCVEHGELARLTIDRVAKLFDVPPGLLVTQAEEAPCAGTAPAPADTPDADHQHPTATAAPAAAATESATLTDPGECPSCGATGYDGECPECEYKP